MDSTGQPQLGSLSSFDPVPLPERRSLLTVNGADMSSSPGRSSRWRTQGSAAIIAPEPPRDSPPALPSPRQVSQLPGPPAGRFPPIYRTSLPGFPGSGASSCGNASNGALSLLVRSATDEGTAVGRASDEKSLLRLAVSRAQGGGANHPGAPSAAARQRSSGPGSVFSDEDTTPHASDGTLPVDPVAAILEAQLEQYLVAQARKSPYGSPSQRRYVEQEREALGEQASPGPDATEVPGPQVGDMARAQSGPLLPSILSISSPTLAARKDCELAPPSRLDIAEPEDEEARSSPGSRAAGHESDTEVEHRRQRQDPTVAMGQPHAVLLTVARWPHSPSLGSNSTRVLHRLSYNGHYAGAVVPAAPVANTGGGSAGGCAVGSLAGGAEVGSPRLSLVGSGGAGPGSPLGGCGTSFPRHRLLATHQSVDGTPSLLHKPLQQLDGLPYINPNHSECEVL